MTIQLEEWQGLALAGAVAFVGYVLMAGVVAGIFARCDKTMNWYQENDRFLVYVFGILWPITVPITIVLFVLHWLVIVPISLFARTIGGDDREVKK